MKYDIEQAMEVYQRENDLLEPEEECIILWQSDNGVNSIIFDGYGIGHDIDDTQGTHGFCYCNRFSVYDSGEIGYDWPEIVPKYVRRQIERFVRDGIIIDARHVDMDKWIEYADALARRRSS